MSQIYIYSYNLQKKDVVITDVTVKTYDCITPQKTTFEILKDYKIAENDIIIIKDSQDYIGIIDTITKGQTLEVSMYPIEHIFDNDLDIDKLDGSLDVVSYLTQQITKNFIDNDDYLMVIPFVFENQLTEPVTYKTIVDSNNLLDIINDIYLNTGVYMEYMPVYTDGRLTNIKIIFKNVSEQKIIMLRYDNPQIVDKINYEFSNTSTNKVTIFVGKTATEKGTPYRIYLREDNQLTSNPKDPYRIKKVINKNIDFTADKEVQTPEQYAEAIILMAEKELKGSAFDYEITFTMLINPNRQWHYRQSCVFTAEDRVFYSLVTRLEYLTAKTVQITLGAYRTRLTEKIQKIMKRPKEVGGTLGGIPVTNGLGEYLYWFEKDTDGNLYVCSENMTSEELYNLFELDTNKNLYVNYKDTQRESLSIDSLGNLQGSY